MVWNNNLFNDQSNDGPSDGWRELFITVIVALLMYLAYAGYKYNQQKFGATDRPTASPAQVP